MASSSIHRNLDFVVSMDARRHSVDLPISRTLVALRRVRSLRDPSTSSMSKLSILGFDSSCIGGSSYNDMSRFRSSSLLMANEQNLSDHELHYSSRHCESGQARVFVGDTSSTCQRSTSGEDSDSCTSEQEMVCKKKELSGKTCKEEDERLEFNERETILMQSRKRGWNRPRRRSWNRKHNRLSRVTAGDVLSCVVSPCLSTSDDPNEGSSSGMSLYRREDDSFMESGHRGCGISSCWSRTLKSYESNLQSDVEELPLLLTDKGIDYQHDCDGFSPFLETPRSLCQKFMPKTFKELVGQNVVARSLLSEISNRRIASLYLFHGPRGVGKTSAARVFAAALNCLSPEIDKPCGLCQDCVLFFSGKNKDVKEIDSVTINRKDMFRLLVKNSDVAPSFSRFRVYIIDECHLLQGETWTALLNKLEKLPQHVVFIMVTPDLDNLPCSVVSKLKTYHFQTVTVVDIASRLAEICGEEGLEFDKDALSFIANKSNGSLREAAMMLDQLSLLGKKITMSLVYEVNGVVSDDELLDLLRLALSSDASNTVKRARELMRSRIDPLQLISQLANLIMDILAGKCEKDVSEVRRRLFGTNNSEADTHQLNHALKVLSETEKQLRTSNNQTWVTVALLQLGSTSNDESNPRLSSRSHPQDGDFLGTSSTGECLKHAVTGSCENVESRKTGIQDDMECLELFWKRTTRSCESSSFKNFLQKHGKLVSLCLNPGVAVAELEFDHPDYVAKAEKSWKEIACALQHMLGYNVELRINLATNAANKYGKFKKRSFSLFGYSCRMQHWAECGSNASENSSYTPGTIITGSRFVETCSSDCGLKILHTCCHGKEIVTSIRNADGNSLSVRMRTPHILLSEREDQLAADSLNDEINDIRSNPVDIKPQSRSRQREYWKLHCWRTAIFPFQLARNSFTNATFGSRNLRKS